uniref:LAGLIDADG homing endonuclease n=1 Tax=Coleochaete scutata TaxID=3125 RepID=A0A5P9NVV3_COLSC|nr:hypothetical protein [Coleochaete scutata]QFU80106.1 hypothetical protein [Coleochaete scutata]
MVRIFFMLNALFAFLLSNLRLFIGGGYAIKTVVQAIPHPTGKVIVSSLGLTALFATSRVEDIVKASRRGTGPKAGSGIGAGPNSYPGSGTGPGSFPGSGNSLVDSNRFFPYEIPSEPNAEAISVCEWVGPFSAEAVLILMGALLAELFRKSLLNRLYKVKRFNDMVEYLQRVLPKWLTTSTYKTSESVSMVYIGIICFLVIHSLTNLLVVLMVLKNHFTDFQGLTLAITLNKWCYLPICLLIIEMYKSTFLNYFFKYNAPTGNINYYYVAFLIISVILLVNMILLTLIELPTLPGS